MSSVSVCVCVCSTTTSDELDPPTCKRGDLCVCVCVRQI